MQNTLTRTCGGRRVNERRRYSRVQFFRKRRSVEPFRVLGDRDVFHFCQPFCERTNECVVVARQGLKVAWRVTGIRIEKRAGMKLGHRDGVAFYDEYVQRGDGWRWLRIDALVNGRHQDSLAIHKWCVPEPIRRLSQRHIMLPEGLNEANWAPAASKIVVPPDEYPAP